MNDLMGGVYAASRETMLSNNDDYQLLVMDLEETAVDGSILLNGHGDKKEISDLRDQVLYDLATNNTAGTAETHIAVERARERRRIVIFMSWLSHIGVYVFPVLTVLCLLLYWVIPKKQEWLTMVAAGCGIMTIIAMIFFLYFNNRKEGRDLNDTFLRFRHVLSKRGARSRF